jgi:hypothetical protein
VEHLAIHIPIAKTMAAIYYLFNVLAALKPTPAAVHRPVPILYICQKKNKLNLEKALIKASKFLIKASNA